MFRRYTSLISPSLTRSQPNAIDLATKVCFSLFGGSEVLARLTLCSYEGEIAQCVVPQKLTACLHTDIHMLEESIFART